VLTSVLLAVYGIYPLGTLPGYACPSCHRRSACSSAPPSSLLQPHSDSTSTIQGIGASLPRRAAHRPPRIAPGVIGRRPMLSWTPAWLYAFLHIDADFGASPSTIVVAPCREQGSFLPSLVAALDGSLRGKEQTSGAMFTPTAKSDRRVAGLSVARSPVRPVW